jgi:hypothetical protein
MDELRADAERGRGFTSIAEASKVEGEHGRPRRADEHGGGGGGGGGGKLVYGGG